MADLTSLLQDAGRIMVFTGAGISTGSGIPDYRGPGGVWTRRQPVYYQDFLDDEAQRIEYWDFKLESWTHFRGAQPNATHAAIVTFEQLGKVLGVVTQNTDGLHLAAGSSPGKVIELHGTNQWIECVTCDARSRPDAAMRAFEETRVPPRCPCGGLLKPATISFGQQLRPEVLQRGAEVAQACDLVLALGSTLSVHPAAGLPLLAARRGVPYVVINRGPTDHDALATLRIEGDVAAVLPPAVDALRAAS